MKTTFDMTPIFRQLISNSALLWSIAEKTVAKEDWDEFIKLYERKKRIELLDMLEAMPHLFSDNVDELKEQLRSELDGTA